MACSHTHLAGHPANGPGDPPPSPEGRWSVQLSGRFPGWVDLGRGLAVAFLVHGETRDPFASTGLGLLAAVPGRSGRPVN